MYQITALQGVLMYEPLVFAVHPPLKAVIFSLQ